MEKSTFGVTLLLICGFAITSYAEDALLKNSIDIQERQDSEIQIPLKDDRVNRIIYDIVDNTNLSYKILRNCASFDNVRNRTDLGQCAKMALVSTMPFAMAGQRPDGNNGILYRDWRNNYSSIEVKKKIHTISSEKLDELFVKHAKCVINTAKKNTYYDEKVLRNDLKEKCVIRENEILK